MKEVHIVAKETIWRPFCLCKLDGQELNILPGNRVYRIQHTQIRLESLVPCFYPKMPLDSYRAPFFRNPTRLLAPNYNLHSKSNSTDNAFQDYLKTANKHTLFFKSVTANEIITIVENKKNDTSSGIDDIHVALKETYHFFRATLTKIHFIKINHI